MTSFRVLIVSLVAAQTLFSSLQAEIRLPAILSDHMVLQQNREVPIWGWAEPGETITVEIAGQTKRTSADEEGKWRVELAPLQVHREGLEMRISGQSQILLEDILVGEVWLASGQSNMQFALSGTDTAEAEIIKANFPEIRLFKVPRNSALKPAEDTSSSWNTCTPATAASFSAVAYFFGRRLHLELKVPVGLIDSSWGGTQAEEWTKREWLEGKKAFAPILERWEQARPVLEELFQSPTPFRMEIDNFVFLPKDPEQPPLILDDMNDRDLATSLFGRWNTRGDFDLETVPIIDPTYAPAALVISGRSRVGETPGLHVQFSPARLNNLSDYRAVRFDVRGEGSLKYHSLQPTITDSDNYATPLIELSRSWQRVTIEFESLQQAGWGKAQQFSPEALSGAEIEVHPATTLIRPPSGLFNGMISPLIPYSIRGVNWYQGEGNAGRAYQYRQLLPAMISSWRESWDQGDFPFLIVQLPNFKERKEEPSESSWAELREAQLETHRQAPKTGLAVTIDLGEPDDVHPRSKVEVGERLASWALGPVYGIQQVFSGPIFEKISHEASRIRVHFQHTGSGLFAAGKIPLKGFAIAGGNRIFVPAQARIDGESVLVWSDQVEAPVAVRFAWADNPEMNLYNREGFPASPFRSDDWPGLTVDAR